MTSENRNDLFDAMRNLPPESQDKILSVVFAQMEGCENAEARYRTDDFFRVVQTEVDFEEEKEAKRNKQENNEEIRRQMF